MNFEGRGWVCLGVERLLQKEGEVLRWEGPG